VTALDQLSYTPRQAAEKTGVSEYTIGAAIRSGDLRTVQPEVNGRRIRKHLILHADLLEWLRGVR
jgi:excisionase family DNA binding protein